MGGSRPSPKRARPAAAAPARARPKAEAKPEAKAEPKAEPKAKTEPEAKEERRPPSPPRAASSPSGGGAVADDRPACRWGAACYRKNPAHLAQFRHPEAPAPPRRDREPEREREPARVAPAGGKLPPLPSFFQYLEAYVDGPLRGGRDRFVSRHFVAFGGDLSRPGGGGGPATTHVVTERAAGDAALAATRARCPDAVVVRPSWVEECVRTRSLAPEAAHAV